MGHRFPNYLTIYLFFFFVFYVPCFATITLETASGTLVPAARNVIPITESGIFNVSPENSVVKIMWNLSYLVVSYLSFSLFFCLSKSIWKSLRTDYRDHPSNDITQWTDPNDTHKKRNREPIFKSWLLAIRYCAHENQMNWPSHDPSCLSYPSTSCRPY